MALISRKSGALASRFLTGVNVILFLASIFLAATNYSTNNSETLSQNLTVFALWLTIGVIGIIIGIIGLVGFYANGRSPPAQYRTTFLLSLLHAPALLILGLLLLTLAV